MFQYEFEAGDYARAIAQAKAYETDKPFNRIKGNLGEIAFHEFCRQYLAIDQWHWHHGDNVRRAETEHTVHDFEVLGHEFDVKARTDLNYFYYLERDDIESDYGALVWLRDPTTGHKENSTPNPKDIEYGILLGYIDRSELPKKSKETDSERFRKLNEKPLSYLTELEPTAHRGAPHIDCNGHEISLGDIVIDTEQEDSERNRGLVVERPDVPCYRASFSTTDGKKIVSQYRGKGDNTKYDPQDPVVGIIYLEGDNVPSKFKRLITKSPKALATRVDNRKIYRYPAGRLKVID